MFPKMFCHRPLSSPMSAVFAAGARIAPRVYEATGRSAIDRGFPRRLPSFFCVLSAQPRQYPAFSAPVARYRSAHAYAGERRTTVANAIRPGNFRGSSETSHISDFQKSVQNATQPSVAKAPAHQRPQGLPGRNASPCSTRRLCRAPAAAFQKPAAAGISHFPGLQADARKAL